MNDKGNLILLIALSFLGTHNLFGQSRSKLLPESIGVNGFLQRTSTVMHSQFITPYYNTWGFNGGFGLMAQFRIKDNWSMKVFYHRAKLMNTYNIVRHNPGFTPNDRKEYQPFSYYWTSYEVGIGYKYTIKKIKHNGWYFEQSVCTNYAQLVYDNFAFDGTQSDVITKDIVFQDGIPAKITYVITQISVRNSGLNFLNGLTYEREVGQRLNLTVNLSYNVGLVPLIGTRINYVISTEDARRGGIGEHYATSNNSGFRLSMGLNYVIKKMSR